MKENGVNISRRHERNDADSRDIICVVFLKESVSIIEKVLRHVRIVRNRHDSNRKMC